MRPRLFVLVEDRPLEDPRWAWALVFADRDGPDRRARVEVTVGVDGVLEVEFSPAALVGGVPWLRPVPGRPPPSVRWEPVGSGGAVWRCVPLGGPLRGPTSVAWWPEGAGWWGATDWVTL